MDQDLIRLLVLLALACVASAYDVAWRTIPNWVTGAGFVAGLLIASYGGVTMIGLHLLTAVLTLLVLLPLFATGALGGGDVKLLVAVGMLLGPSSMPAAAALGAAAGGALAIAEAVRKGVILPLVLESRDAVAYYVSLGSRGQRATRSAAASVTVPYGLAIGIGAVGACLL